MFKVNRIRIWQIIKKEIPIWRTGALPGLTVLVIVIVARLNGLLQPLEWMAFDQLLRLRPVEPMDNRITIIGINEYDIKNLNTYPIPDIEIAGLIKKIRNYQPRVIGLDIFKDIPVEPGHQELIDVFKETKNLIAIEKVLPPKISPSANLPSKQLGFADVIADKDGGYRRILLGTPVTQNVDEYKYSLSLRLAQIYLAHQGINLENGINDPSAMRFSSVEIPRFLANHGGYVGVDAGGNQTLMNWRSGRKPFRFLSLNDIKTGNFKPQWLQNRIVLIGITAPSVPDYLNTRAVISLENDEEHEEIYGVKFHAHATSQIISAVLDGRPLLKVWPEEWEYFWIVVWGFVPILIGRLTQCVSKNLLAVALISIFLVGVDYQLILWGYWIPIAPSLLILGINSVGLSAFTFYQRDKVLRYKIAERQRTIDYTFTLIHNGPLQTLANTLTGIQEKDFPKEKLRLQLENLNLEIRQIGEYLKFSVLNQEETIRLGNGLKLNLMLPIHELFYEVYTNTLERDLPNFQSIKLKARCFEPIEENFLNPEQKRELCEFLEEALCNIGKHALGVKHLQATGKEKQGWYILSIQDNGCGISFFRENTGTMQAVNLAKKLGGYFKREPALPRGTLCELTWPLRRRRYRITDFLSKRNRFV